MSGDAAVAAADLGFAYGERKALDGVSFAVRRGSVHGFLGPNGSGKSTLFKLLSTLVPPQQGRVTVLGRDLATEAAAIRARIGVVFQSPAVDKKLTVRENLRYGGMLLGLSGRDLAARSDELLAATNLAERAGDLVGELSGGLRRRVEIAKCLLGRPELVLLDEASTGLDPAARADMWAALRRQPGLTVLFTTHLMDEAAEADQLLLLDQGRVVAAGRPADLMREVGGQVLELEAADAPALARDLEQALGVRGVVVEGVVRIETARAHDLVPPLIERFGDRVLRLQLAHPSLQDVFLQRTGRRFPAADTAEAPQRGRRRRS
jgi:ABC-2 type transport system ATP-binding protein